MYYVLCNQQTVFQPQKETNKTAGEQNVIQRYIYLRKAV